MASGGGSAPKAPKFVPLDIPSVMAGAEATDRRAYQLSDSDLAKRHPEIPKGTNASIANAALNLGGQQDPALTSLLQQSGSGINFGNTNQDIARNMGKKIQDKEGRDRDYFKNLMSQNPERQIGLNSDDYLRMVVANANGANTFAQGTFGSRVNAYNANLQQGAQNTSALLSSIAGIAKIGGNLYSNPYVNPSQSPLNTQYYNVSPDYAAATGVNAGYPASYWGYPGG